ncbi:alpha-mannosidase [Thermococcus chitonophagus]|uniref:Alpha-mannosidase n=1 Tax=Thermococcus chitonophagus TaxID=54262 RepID=A0A160VTH6_9EURY|nr:glycoside hydrolase family 38 C-terminal domain-containing protein [Thermococcus chitonophagus]ASJ16800.1 alpha-mannosidase [Thermococcus chitonophagus]CUX78272.1 Alpha-mannosidase [Thermococcus chitonophagus]
MLSLAEIERKAFDLMATSIRKHAFLPTWDFEGKSINLPFEVEAKPGDFIRLKTTVEVPRDGLKWFIKVCMEGNALVRLDGMAYGTIDDVHTYIPIRPGRHELELIISPLTMFGYHKWRIKIEYAMLVGIMWEPYVLAQRLLDLISFIEVLQEEDLREALLKELSDILITVKTVPSLRQITLLRMLLYDGGLGIKELKLGRFDIREVRTDYMFLSAVYGIGELKGYIEDIPRPSKEEYLSEISDVEEKLEKALARLRKAFPKVGKAYAFAHSHIDAAWLWTYAETKQKILRTFSTIERLMRRYGITYVQSSAQYYEWLEELDKDLFEKVKRFIEEGKWILVGGMWVESDVQLIDGESIARQLLYGQRYFKEKFNKTARIGWLPDTFGFPASLPQFLKKSGLEMFATYKLLWNERNEFPYHAFIWKGVDGTEIPVHLMMSYKSSMTAKSLYKQWKRYKNKYEVPFLLYAYGYGDGGGGITWEMVEMMKHMNKVPYIPKLIKGTEEEYLRELKEHVSEMPTWEGELYVEVHRGTYTTNLNVKKLMAEAESKLRSAEIWASLAHSMGIMEYPKDKLEKLWKRTLLHQFHDVLPGSSIKEVYDEVIRDLEDVIREADEIIREATERIAQGESLVFNDLPWEREEVIEIDGKPVLVKAYPLGWSSLKPIDEGFVKAYREDDTFILENDYLRVKINDEGEIISLYNKELKWEGIRSPSNVIMAHVDTPGMWDAWDVNEDFLIQGKKLKTVRVEITRNDGYIAEITVEKIYGNSKVIQRIRLKRKSKLLEFHTEVDWWDKEVLLKAWFNFNTHNWSAYYDIPYGVIRRPAVRNTPWEQAKFEVPALRWADVSDGEHGVAIICTSRHGYTNWDSKIGLSLLKSPIYPNPWSDTGKGEFTYYLYPHKGYWFEGEVYKRALEVWSPLRVTEGSPGKRKFSLMRTDAVVGAIKLSEDGDGYIIRLYNPSKGDLEVEIPSEGVEVDIPELKVLGKVKNRVKLGAFEIKTIKVSSLAKA